MATNYPLLKESKNDLFDEISRFFEHIVKMNKKVFETYKNENTINEEVLKEISNDEEQSDILYEDALNSSIWIIQTNSPRAGHLRFIVSCMNSAKELEKASDYIYDVALFLNKVKLDDELNKNFMKSFEKCIYIVSNAYELFLNKEMSETKKEIKQLLREYEAFVKEQIKSTIHCLSRDNIIDEQENTILVDLVMAFNYLEKVIVHVYNVIKAFNYIDLNR